MADLAFEFEWVDPGGARGPELRATWARFAIRVAGDPVTRVFDRQTRSVRESLYLPLYPFAEWVASNWWRLLYEVRSPRISSRNGYEARHILSAAAEGFALPHLSFEPMGDILRLSWTSKTLTHTHLEFLGGGSAFLTRAAVVEHLQGFVVAVLGRLEDEGVQETPLHQEWRAIQQADPEEEAFCRLAAALGLDPFQIADDQTEALLAAAAQIPEQLEEEFFSVADPLALLEEASALRKALEAISGAHERLEPLLELRESFSTSQTDDTSFSDRLEVPPWNQGYSAARALRAHLDLDGCPLPSFESIGKALGLEGDVLDEEVLGVRGLVTVDGVVALDAEQRPGFAVRPVAEEARRFSFCRELLEYLSVQDMAPRIVTRGGTARQQRNRAFAAEFLLPSDGLRSRIPGDVVSYQEVNEIAQEFGVSWATVSHQLENHRIARVIPD